VAVTVETTSDTLSLAPLVPVLVSTAPVSVISLVPVDGDSVVADTSSSARLVGLEDASVVVVDADVDSVVIGRLSVEGAPVVVVPVACVRRVVEVISERVEESVVDAGGEPPDGVIVSNTVTSTTAVTAPPCRP
jgi:hypothetical protein